ncbi:MAG: hypothetical protein WCR84_01350 [Candidatus Paceibacterota bacterium]|nr:hypothetical protein [Candidatus Paceibacterota bacterium]
MFNFFKKKCLICKMELKKGKDYPVFSGKKFCSDNCIEEYKKEIIKMQSKGDCCH